MHFVKIVHSKESLYLDTKTGIELKIIESKYKITRFKINTSTQNLKENYFASAISLFCLHLHLCGITFFTILFICTIK